MSIPGLKADGTWDVPDDVNMARQCLEHDPNQVAVIDLTQGERWDVTYSDLNLMVDGIARTLMARVQRGDRVGVLLSQSPWCVAAHIACWKIGVISVPLFKLFQHEALKTRVQDAGCEIVLTDPGGRELLGNLAEAWLVDQIGVGGGPVPYSETGPETPSILIYTSGTTGKPKGALHGHRMLTGHFPGVYLHHNHLGQEGDVLWTPADWAWIGGLFNIAMAGLALGVPIVAARMEKFTAQGMLDILATSGARNLFLPPTVLRMLKAEDVHVPGLRSVMCGGEPLGAEMLDWGRRAFGLTINETFGQTECNLCITTSSTDYDPMPGTAGKPTPGFEVAVIDADGAPCTFEGDIAVRRGSTPAEMLEYWQRPEATAEKYRGDWMLMGDRGERDGDFIRFVGRDDDVITSAGYRIGPSEIEDCLLTHPAVATVGVVGKPDDLRTEIVKAYVVLKSGASAGAAELQDWVKSRLAAYSYPREVEFLDALPMTVTGKVIRKELKARAAGEVSL